jgi:hypothetical protein
MQHWQENAGSVALHMERFAAALDPRHPASGIASVLVDGVAFDEFHALGLELVSSGDAAEHYIRGGDLIASYVNRPAPEMRSEAYWRVESHARFGAIAAIELVASVQTSLLDGSPLLSTRSQLIACEAFQLVDAAQAAFARIVPPTGDEQPAEAGGNAHCYLFRLPGRRYSYAEMVYPSDSHRSQWDGWLHGTDYRIRLRHELFPERLEKGVILRARVLGVLLDAKDDKAATVRHWESFLSEKLPLTA